MSPVTLTQRTPSALSIDEILEHVFSFLDQLTLKFVAARVCSRWFWIARDLFQHHLVLNHNDDPRILIAALSQKLALANRLTIGRSIGPWHDLLFEAEAAGWDRMMGLLVRALSKAKGESGNQGDFPQIKALTLYVEHWWVRPHQVLDCFNPRNLKELTIDVPFETGPLPLRTMLDQCPSLLHLSLSTRKWSRTCRISDQSLRTWIPENAEHEGHHESTRTETWPLRSLRLRDIVVSPTALKSYLPRLGEITEIYLLEVRDPKERQDTFHNRAATTAFWLALAKHCQKLKAIQLGCQICSKESSAIPIHLFPKVYNFGIQGSAYSSLAIWKALTIHRVENRLTTLELLGDGRYLRSEPRDQGYVRHTLLHRFLCHSPLLLHLKTGQLRISTRVLWGGDIDRASNKMSKIEASNIWACRSLVTLSLRFESSLPFGNDGVWGAGVLGYLSRVCPNMEELSLGVDLQGWALQSGMCLLTRLKFLRRLELCMEGSLHPDWNPPQRRDFVWIQGNTATTGSQLTTSRPMAVARKIVPSILRPYLFRSHGSLKNLLDDYRHCIDVLLTNKDIIESSNFKRDRERMHQQQQEHRFVSDVERPMPMVDGLVDFEFSGSNLDIEACLQARLFHLQEQQGEDVWLPWPHMEQMVFTYEYLDYRSDKSLEKRVARGCKLLRSCRPDIDILCRFGILGTYNY